MPTKERPSKGLQKTLGLSALIIYAVGDILGAGIYALVGKVAGAAGSFTWIAFAVALLVALVTALSYSEMAARFPKSGGAAHFCQQAFDKAWLSQWVGWLVLWSGIISLATATVAFSGYFRSLGIAVPREFLILGFLSLLGFINFWGMRESSAMNLVCTAVEFSGLLVVIYLGIAFAFGESAPPVAASEIDSLGVFRGAALAFFAFIGFEDLVNVAEEAKEPREHIPIACMGGLLLAGTVFVTIAWIAPLVMAPVDLAASGSPLVDVVVTARPGFPRQLFGAVALFAVANTALLNFVMASRLLYGMANEKLIPQVIGKLHAKRRTPYVAIFGIYGVVTLLALVGPLEFLAATTSCLILTVFFIVHVALFKLKRREKVATSGFRVPLFVPVIGTAFTLGLVSFIPGKELLSAVGVAVVSLGIVLVGSRSIKAAKY